MPSPSHVAYEVVAPEPAAAPSAPFARITLDFPERRNALSLALLDQLQAALDRAAHDDVRSVVLAANGPAFCSGADLTEALADGMTRSARRLAEVLRTIIALPRPVVARVHGPVRAGGIGLVAACDVAISADHITYAFTEARLALAPAVISLAVLPRMAPRAASRTFLTGAPFTAAEAAAWGLVTQAVPSADLDQAVDAVLAELAAGDPQGLAATKELLNADLLTRFDAHVDDAVTGSAELFGSERARAAMERLLRR
ncbi:methylglutaconyl-CoA hydratase [Promicromonospora umidemergens]|uniref:Enoyl-CoA hydratase family protein n=1 Tax=Promicromonospora umidemergens TaxID=629679 RepID=A0ABP8YFE3_9MICO|nr:enoyl-CoA hydratase-related protein [Promicromonospora umidemergens]MCP2286852.1 methylglutaconyl-CoA hydratase [Promicromonospora umidemergens]